MTRKRELVFLESLLTSGLDLMTQMPSVSEAMKRLVPSFSLSMIRVDERCAPRHHYSEHFDEVSHRLFAESGHAFSAATDDPAAFGNLLAPGRRPYGTLIEGGEDFVTGATYQHLFARNGIHHVLDVAISDRGGPLGILGIFRERDAPRFRQADVDIAAELYPWLVHAFAAHRGAASREESRGLLEYDEVDSGLLVVKRSGLVVWASPGARAWLEDASAGPERGRLMDRPSHLPEACRALGAMLDAARRGKGIVPTLTLPLAGGRLRMRAYGLVADGETDGGDHFGVQLSLEMSRGLRVRTALHLAGLSTQQQRLALSIWQNEPAHTIREKLGVSASTLKSYQKSLYVRLGVNSASELATTLDTQARALTFDLRRHLPRRG
jgi:hypothetical protein